MAEYKQAKTDGHVSVADFWLEKFQCGEEAIVDSVGRNPRLFRSDIKAMCEKVDILLRYGATLDDVRAHSHVVKNRTVATIETRARELSRQCAPPLSVAWIAQSEYIYQEILHNYSTVEDEQADKLSYIQKASKPINLVIYRNNLAAPTRRTTLICGIKYHTSVGSNFAYCGRNSSSYARKVSHTTTL